MRVHRSAVVLMTVLLLISVAAPAATARVTILATDPDAGILFDGRRETIVPRTGVPTRAVEVSLPARPVAARGETAQVASLRSKVGHHADIIMGGENRVAVGGNSDDYPYRTVVFIESGSGWCTGFMYTRRAVATAAHCIYDNGKYKTIGRIYPGRNGSTKPYGSCGKEVVTIPSGWKQYEEGQWKYDYGTIVLDCNMGDRTGWLGYSTSPDSIGGTSVNLEGYPQDKAFATMWRSPGKITDVSTDIFHFDNDTQGGNSGGGLRKSDNYVIGINSHDSQLLHFNAAVRITSTVFNNLKSWATARLVA